MNEIVQKTFWFVYCTTGFNPKHRHDTEISAESEAERLAKNCPGTEFMVLEAKSSFKKTDVIRTRFKIEDPF